MSFENKVIRANYLDTEEYHLAAWQRNSRKPIILLIVPWIVPVAAFVMAYDAWRTVVSATEYSDGIFLSMDEAGFGYYWIPTTAFNSLADYATVLAHVTTRVSKHDKRR